MQRLLERDTNVTFPVISNPNNMLAKTFLPKHSQYKLPTPDHLNKNVYDGVNFIPYSGQQPALLFIDNKGELIFCWSMKNDLPKGTGHTKETCTRGTVGDPWIRVKPDSIVQLINDIQNKKDKDSLKAETIDLLPKDFSINMYIVNIPRGVFVFSLYVSISFKVSSWWYAVLLECSGVLFLLLVVCQSVIIL